MNESQRKLVGNKSFSGFYIHILDTMLYNVQCTYKQTDTVKEYQIIVTYLFKYVLVSLRNFSKSNLELVY